MSQDVHLDCYRAALNAANVELSEIVGEFDQLQVRKDRLEVVLAALKPIMGFAEQVSSADRPDADRSSELIEQAMAPSPEPMQETEEATQYGFMQVAEKLGPRLKTPGTSWSNLLERPARVAMG
jgi:hypothetical protein